MTEVLQANIFFFITACAIIVFTMLLCVALFHVIKLLKSVRRIVARVDEGTEALSEDMHTIRTHIAGGGILRKLAHFLFGSKDHSTEDDEEDTPVKKKNAERKRDILKIKDES